MHKIIAISAAAIAALLTACFNPSRQEGLTCSDEGLCPDGLFCAADQVCRSSDQLIDSGQASDALNVNADASDGCLFADTSICAAGPLLPIVITLGENELLDTDIDDRCRSFTLTSGQEACLLYTERFEIEVTASLRVAGGRPLLVASRTTITISGRMDGSSSLLDGILGPGSNDPGCALLSPGADDSKGGGGGAGGSFQGPGGDGGDGSIADVPAPGATAAIFLAGVPDTIRGGCPGSAGGLGELAPTVAQPGSGGGSMAFIAVDAITLSPTGLLLANGSGAQGSILRGGGAGGGSGGMVTLEAPFVQLEGLLLAEGGGGGGGARGGDDGSDGLDPSDTSAGQGGQGGGTGVEGDEGDGGEGSASGDRGEHSGVEGIMGDPGRRAGGGGGGGGAGYLIVTAQSLQNLILTASPAITILNE